MTYVNRTRSEQTSGLKELSAAGIESKTMVARMGVERMVETVTVIGNGARWSRWR